MGATDTAIEAVSVQPCAFVTVTVYKPAEEIEAVLLVPRPLSQAYVVPPPAVTLITGVLQSIIFPPVLLVIVAVGLGFTTTCVVT